jgi:hypothetical protein
MTLGGVGTVGPKTSLLQSERNSASITAFHVSQSERFRHSIMDFGSGFGSNESAIFEAKYMSTTVVFL